jgi:hypothetical protein
LGVRGLPHGLQPPPPCIPKGSGLRGFRFAPGPKSRRLTLVALSSISQITWQAIGNILIIRETMIFSSIFSDLISTNNGFISALNMYLAQ